MKITIIFPIILTIIIVESLSGFLHVKKQRQGFLHVKKQRQASLSIFQRLPIIIHSKTMYIKTYQNWLVVWNYGILWLSIQLGMSSSQLTYSLHHFSEG